MRWARYIIVYCLTWGFIIELAHIPGDYHRFVSLVNSHVTSDCRPLSRPRIAGSHIESFAQSHLVTVLGTLVAGLVWASASLMLQIWTTKLFERRLELKAFPTRFAVVAVAVIEAILPGIPAAYLAKFAVNLSLPTTDCGFVELAPKYVTAAFSSTLTAFCLACLVAGYAAQKRETDVAHISIP